MAKKVIKNKPKKSNISKTKPNKLKVSKEILEAHPNFDKYPDFIKKNIIANS